MKAKVAAPLLRWMAALALPPLLCLLSMRLLLTHEFLRYEYLRPGFPADPYGFGVNERLDYGFYAIDYLFNGEGIGFLADLRLPGDLCYPASDAADCAMFSPLELRHMQDVKALTSLAFAFGLGLLILFIGIGWRARSDPRLKRSMLRGLRFGCVLTLAAIVSLATIAAASWHSAFDGFHTLLFAAGTWRFPFSATLIRLYPERLFVDAAIGMAILTGLAAILIMLALERLGRDEFQVAT